MSADLFAAFESAPSNSDSQKNRSQSGTVPPVAAPSDPFSFLNISGPTAPPQLQPSRQHQAFQWQPTVTHTAPPPTASLWPAPPPAQPQDVNVWGDLVGLGSFQGAPLPPRQEPVKEDDDDWGDFEAPQETSQTPAPPDTRSNHLRTRVVRASTMDMLSNNLVDLGTISSAHEVSKPRPLWEEPAHQDPPRPTQIRAADPNVLFDAADFELQDEAAGDDEDDDFGNFEAEPAPTLPSTRSAVSSFGSMQPNKETPIISLGGSTTNAKAGLSSAAVPGAASFGATQPKKQPPNLSLASPTTTSSNGSLYPQAPKSPYGSFQTRKPDPMKELKVKTPQTSEFPKEVKPQSPSPTTAWPSGDKNDDFDNDWADFEDLTPDDAIAPAKPNTSTESSKKTGGGPPGPDVSTLKPPLDTTTETTVGPPPTNIPPPAVLLSIFPQLLDLATTSLLKPISSLPASSQQLVASHEATLIFLRGHLALATVAARIMAGRKQRWHRDKFLMQGMAISAAGGVGGKSGMKLAGIDKTQSAREDREAAEVLAVWKAQVGRLRSAVAAANAAAASKSGSGLPPLKVPELGLNVSAHAAVGAMTAPKPCVVCGLKRDERIAKVDFDVEDSFGEWWVEFWGHRTCRNFWLQHEVKLRQR